MQVQGLVQKIFPRTFNGRTFYSFTVLGTDGFFGTGPKKPPSEGTSVSFEARTNAKGFLEVDMDSIKALEDGPPTTASVAKLKGKSVEEKGFWERKELREVRNDQQRELGASRNTAISIIDLMLKHEAVPLPKTAAKKEDFVWELVNKYTDKLMGKDGGEGEAKTEATEVTGDVTDEDTDWN